MIKIINNTIQAQNKYGHGYGSETIVIDEIHIDALLDGKQLAFGINDEYVTFLTMQDPYKRESEEE